MTKSYELTCIISGRLEEAEMNKTAENLTHIIKENDGKITAMTPPGSVNLGYPIKEEQKGYMAIFVFNYNGKKAGEIKNKAEKLQGVLRCFLATKRPPRIFNIRPKPKIAAIIEKAEPEKKGKEEDQKVSLEEIDKKLEEIFNPKKNEPK